MVGRRERKKLATRSTIAAAALELFVERGFDAVGIREVADRADVAVATVFAHFESKEALVFDQDEEVVRSLLAAVEHRPTGVDVLAALQTWFLATHVAEVARGAGNEEFAAFRRLVDATPALQEYWCRSWRRHEPALAAAIARVTGVEGRLAHLAATLTVEGYLLAARNDGADRTLALLFRVLRAGLADVEGASPLISPVAEDDSGPFAASAG